VSQFVRRMEEYIRNTEPLCGCLVLLFNCVRVLVCNVDYMLGKGLFKEGKIGTMPAVIDNEYIENNTKRWCLPRRKEDGTVGAVSSKVARTTCAVIGNVGTKERDREIQSKGCFG
jgi:hypothetical protein